MKSARDRALIVEDSSTIAAIVKHYLELEGFEVLVATDGLAGLATARRERPDLIVTDMNLPLMDGLDMVRALRADKPLQHMSIFMLTSDASAETERRARRSAWTTTSSNRCHPNILRPACGPSWIAAKRAAHG